MNAGRLSLARFDLSLFFSSRSPRRTSTLLTCVKVSLLSYTHFLLIITSVKCRALGGEAVNLYCEGIRHIVTLLLCAALGWLGWCSSLDHRVLKLNTSYNYELA